MRFAPDVGIIDPTSPFIGCECVPDIERADRVDAPSDSRAAHTPQSRLFYPASVDCVPLCALVSGPETDAGRRG
jgi:hypothetical protein